MAVKLSANYSKKLGLPQFSSHSFSASVEIELTDITQVEAEVQKLYQLLQHSVDQEIQEPGFVPQASNGHGNAHNNTRAYPVQGQVRQQPKGFQQPRANGDAWNCTDGQRGFILRIVSDNNLDKQEAEDLSQQLFGLGVKQLNKMQASQLIEDLLVKAGKPGRQTRWQQRPAQRQAA
ncbi:hypothetical protein [Prosthecobacter dejongeii]|uniref:Uncharacterized protein n=1 Tax=Prosthecobacter dejongeii TaxID=48465 RepID=A0A7W7YK85_9BACT|nr:hypothetical protein [Prosthecobacter dejongeii]MBB5037542.1 hypothetical protein [Prosthecobacter dejongeii]